jgi:hypothetical protein
VIRPAHRGTPVCGGRRSARRVAAPECATAQPWRLSGAAHRLRRRHPAQRPEPTGAIREPAPVYGRRGFWEWILGCRGPQL